MVTQTCNPSEPQSSAACEPIRWANGPLNLTETDPLLGYVYVDVMDCIDIVVRSTLSLIHDLRPW